MTVKELRNALQTARDDDVVMICAKAEARLVGGTYAVRVMTAGAGFDWDHGRFLISPECELRRVQSER